MNSLANWQATVFYLPTKAHAENLIWRLVSVHFGSRLHLAVMSKAADLENTFHAFKSPVKKLAYVACKTLLWKLLSVSAF